MRSLRVTSPTLTGSLLYSVLPRFMGVAGWSIILIKGSIPWLS